MKKLYIEAENTTITHVNILAYFSTNRGSLSTYKKVSFINKNFYFWKLNKIEHFKDLSKLKKKNNALPPPGKLGWSDRVAWTYIHYQM